MSIQWNSHNKHEVLQWTSSRAGETKWGEVLDCCREGENFEQLISRTKARFIVLGIVESSGPVGNYGQPGSHNAYTSFVKAFLNIQENRYFDPKKAALGGYISFPFEEKNTEEHRDDVAIIDFQVYEKVKCIFEHGKIPIVIGGGHNNAFPIIKAWTEVNKKQINILNIDPHADFRELEGRHSGNSFSYAAEENMLKNYAVFGLHESYNSEKMLQKMEKSPGVSWITFEKILQNDHPFALFLRYIERLQHHATGFEIDMDAIAHMPASAYTPSGFTLEEIRRLVHIATGSLAFKYLHLPEAAPKSEAEMKWSGKALSFIVTDFMKTLK